MIIYNFVHVLEWFPVGLAALATVFCIYASQTWKALAGRYIYSGIICFLFLIAQVRWALQDSWAYIEGVPEYQTLIWPVIESLLLFVIIFLAKIPKDVGFK